ncbi:MAG TPA: sigma-54 dependent transcriptional regulator [Polyangia bacterium]|jgi:two-component system NtrC family response regulator
MPARILLADDDQSLRRVLEFNLQEEGYEVDAVGSGAEAVARLRERDYDLVVTDIKMPDVDGLAVLDAARRLASAAPVILITAFASVEAAVEAMKRGAYHYVTKPFNRDELRLVVRRALHSSQLEGENRRLRGELEERFRPETLLLGESAAMHAVLDRVRQVAPTDTTVLITGESGTGKELVARALHFGGPRRAGPFVVVNCGAIPRDLLESELFGHVRGAFTGAVRDKQGKFEQANGGTLFLDEIAELPPELQVKLLRVVQEREIERVGEGKPRRVDVRLVAATNRDLEAMIAKGEFREDLYYRINVIPIDLPPLRERAEDIPLLVRHFLKRFAPDAAIAVAPEALEALTRARWRGNVRELMNVCERLVTLRRGDHLETADLPREALAAAERPARLVNLPAEGISLDDLIVQVIVQALERCDWNQTQAARLLRIPRHILLYRMEKYGIAAPGER